MTSPNINKPKPTNEKYNDIYSRGSSFGQDLTESGVRKLLTGRVKSPLSQFLQWGSNLIGNAVNDIADILTGSGGAKYEVLTGAAVERLGDIRTQITEAAKDFQNLADKAEELGTKQDGILEDISAQGVVIEQAKTDASKAIKDAGTVSTALEQYQAAQAAKIRDLTAQAQKGVTDSGKALADSSRALTDSDKALNDAKDTLEALNKYKSDQAVVISNLTRSVDTKIQQARTALEQSQPWMDDLTADIERLNSLETNFKANKKLWDSGIDKAKKDVGTALGNSSKAIDWLESGTQVSNSALPLIPGTSTPTWTEGLTESTKAPSSTADADLPPNITKLYSSGWVGDKSEKTFINPHRNLVTVDSRIEYEASWWMRATRGGRFAYVTLCDETGDRFIVEKLPATELDNNPSQNTWGSPIRALITSPNGTGWTKFTTRFKFKEGVTKVRVYDVNFVNTDNSSGTTYYIADLQINPAIPSQADVDRAQNKAIKANTDAGLALKALVDENTKINGEQTVAAANAAKLIETNRKVGEANTKAIEATNKAVEAGNKATAANTKAIEANNKAIESGNKATAANSKAIEASNKAISANTSAIIALNRTDIGSSLITYLDPTVEEYQNGTARYDTPTWTTAAPHGGIEKPETAAMIGTDRSWGVTDGSRVSKAVVERWVRVQPGVTYKYSFWAYANEPGSKILIELRDRKGELCITDSTIRSNGDRPVNTSYIGGARLLDKGWNFYEGTFKFKDGVDEARFDKIHWNHSDGTAPKYQLIASFDVSPDVPTQADVNKALEDSDKALLKLAEEVDDRSKLNTAFNKEQRRINKVVQAQLWNHQDMIEQLDIRAPKTYGRGPGEGPVEVPPFDGMTADGRRTSHPYFDIWVASRITVVAMKGSWVGEYEISINWTNGAVDHWTVEVTDTDRVFYFFGGSITISTRYVTSTVYPRSLRREARIIRDKIEDPEGLIRSVDGGNIRLKNRATCNKDVRHENFDGSTGWIKAGTVIPSGTELSTDGNSCVFKEVDDPGKGEYVVNQTTPPSNSNVTRHRV